MAKKTPRFKHDCNLCIFEGWRGQVDVYYCPQGGHPTVVFRYGDNGPEYTSLSISLLPLYRSYGDWRAAAIKDIAAKHGY